MITKRIALLATLAAAGLTLSACHGGGEEEAAQPVNATNVEDMAPLDTSVNVATEAPPATRIDNTAAETLPPQAELTADEQTVEDADATGMTARVSRDEGNETGQPAQ
jgi:hypothetical protein